ncbi:MAG: DNA/RNA non-specific endonuclease [Planctomycetales bacterium]
MIFEEVPQLLSEIIREVIKAVLSNIIGTLAVPIGGVVRALKALYDIGRYIADKIAMIKSLIDKFNELCDLALESDGGDRIQGLISERMRSFLVSTLAFSVGLFASAIGWPFLSWIKRAFAKVGIGVAKLVAKFFNFAWEKLKRVYEKIPAMMGFNPCGCSAGSQTGANRTFATGGNASGSCPVGQAPPSGSQFRKHPQQTDIEYSFGGTKYTGQIRNMGATIVVNASTTGAATTSFNTTFRWWEAVTGNVSTGTIVKGHIIAASLGGPNNDLTNLVPLFRRANNPKMLACETRIKKLAKDCDMCITYHVEMAYSKSSSNDPVSRLLPEEVVIRANFTGKNKKKNHFMFAVVTNVEDAQLYEQHGSEECDKTTVNCADY